ncbi:hypothetical protein C0583_05315 [Candidatus Parcubacteria bacterium]|nr:MAG: hypothetical protein C0583_05315 [Candidatus Parcubacteria bacterium]
MKIRRIPHSYFVEVKQELDWEDVLHKLGIKFHSTKKGGSIYEAKCILHNENTPSLTFNPYMCAFHCFGCGQSGDTFNFISYALTGELYNYGRVFRWLNKNFNIPLPWDR